jgi:hypothetical protein
LLLLLGFDFHWRDLLLHFLLLLLLGLNIFMLFRNIYRLWNLKFFQRKMHFGNHEKKFVCFMCTKRLTWLASYVFAYFRFLRNECSCPPCCHLRNESGFLRFLHNEIGVFLSWWGA